MGFCLPSSRECGGIVDLDGSLPFDVAEGSFLLKYSASVQPSASSVRDGARTFLVFQQRMIFFLFFFLQLSGRV